jgi:hypothetical protein
MVPSMVTSPDRKSMREERSISRHRLNPADLVGENVQHPVRQETDRPRLDLQGDHGVKGGFGLRCPKRQRRSMIGP